MTILEERYMNEVPAQLRELTNAIKGLYAIRPMPIIEFVTSENDVRTERFDTMKLIRSGNDDAQYKYYINGYEVISAEYCRIYHLINNHPLLFLK